VPSTCAEIELLDKLVAFDTTSHKSNLAIVAFIEDYLDGFGIAAVRIPSADGLKASLFATIGPTGDGGVALSAHTDVVPVTGQSWTSDPFRLRAAGNRLYGRGTCDMKGFLACVLAAAPRFQAQTLRRPIHLAFSYDEEIGCIGVRPMIAAFGATLPTPDIVIVGEPTSMRVVDAHKGPVRWRVDVQGRAAHSSMAPLGVNAIQYAGAVIAEIEAIAADLRTTARSERFDPPFPTLQVTRIDGGTASNIVPAGCSFEFDLRATPGIDPASIENRLLTFIDRRCLPAMQTVAPEAAITLTRLNAVPPFIAGDDAPAVNLALRLLDQNETHAVSYATEAGLFQSATTSAVVCGPGDIAQAHTADEWIAISELAECSQFLDRLAVWAAA
jgi:acetylornithine deacetylase